MLELVEKDLKEEKLKSSAKILLEVIKLLKVLSRKLEPSNLVSMKLTSLETITLSFISQNHKLMHLSKTTPLS